MIVTYSTLDLKDYWMCSDNLNIIDMLIFVQTKVENREYPEGFSLVFYQIQHLKTEDF